MQRVYKLHCFAVISFGHGESACAAPVNPSHIGVPIPTATAIVVIGTFHFQRIWSWSRVVAGAVGFFVEMCRRGDFKARQRQSAQRALSVDCLRGTLECCVCVVIVGVELPVVGPVRWAQRNTPPRSLLYRLTPSPFGVKRAYPGQHSMQTGHGLELRVSRQLRLMAGFSVLAIMTVACGRDVDLTETARSQLSSVKASRQSATVSVSEIPGPTPGYTFTIQGGKVYPYEASVGSEEPATILNKDNVSCDVWFPEMDATGAPKATIPPGGTGSVAGKGFQGPNLGWVNFRCSGQKLNGVTLKIG